MTQAGPVVIGWRKRVISVSWTDTAVRKVVTDDDTTKGEDHVHAYSYGKAVSYLSQIAQVLNTVRTPEVTNEKDLDNCPVTGPTEGNNHD